MDYKKVALGLMLITSLAGVQVGCGDDGGGSGGGSGGGAGGGSGGGTGGGSGGGTGGGGGPQACQGTVDPGAGDTIRYVLDGLTLPNEDTDMDPGFNLDGVDSDGDDGTGCDQEDDVGGVDNALAGLLSLVGTVAMEADINASIAEAIKNGEIVITMDLKGYNGTGNDDCVHVDIFFTDGEDPNVEDAPARVTDGTVSLQIAKFSLALPLDGADAEVDAYNARFEFDLDTGNGVVGGVVDRGSDTYSYATAGSAREGSLHRALPPILVALLDEETAMGLDTTVETALSSFADIEVNPAGGGECTALSLGAEFHMSPAN